jgi:hypothetical protein
MNVRASAFGALGVIVMVLLVAVCAHFLTAAGGPARPGPTDTPIDRPQRLPSDPADQRTAFEREKQAQLNSYGWIDRERGVTHVPIEKAMQMQADAAAERKP